MKLKISKLLFLLYFIFAIILVFLATVNFTLLKGILCLLFFGIAIYLSKKEIVLNKKLLIVLIIIPILLRVGLLLLDYKNLLSDYKLFYDSAIAISNGSEINKAYIASFPYIYPYMFILGGFFKLFGTSYIMVVLFNLIFDLVGAFFFYKLIYRLTNKKTALIALLIWLYNIFNIIWITKCCPVIIVNSLLIICFYFFIKIKERSIGYSFLFGILLAISNSFRPIMPIFLIAIFIYWCLIKKNNLLYLSRLLIICFSFYSCMFLINKGISYTTGYEVSNKSGWSLYLGSNFKYQGGWNIEDSSEFGEQLIKPDYTPEKLHNHFNEKAIERYKDNGFSNIELLARKSYNAVGRHTQYVSEEFYLFSNIGMNRTIEKLTNFVWLFMLSLHCVGAYQMFKKNDVKYLPYILFGIGLSVASLILEIHTRYITPLYPVIMLVMIMTFCHNLLEKTSKE